MVHNWSVEPNEKLTCPVVHHDGSYYGVRDDEVIDILFTATLIALMADVMRSRIRAP